MLSVISANRLDDGTVTYLAADGNWVGSLAAAKVFAAKDVAAGLEVAGCAVDSNLVVDPLVVEISDAPTGRRTVSLRDAIRAAGPTVRYAAAPDHDEPRSNQSDVSAVFIDVSFSKKLDRDAGPSLRNSQELDWAGNAPRRLTFPHRALDHDDSGLNQSKIMNVIDSRKLERDADGKSMPTFPHPALEAARS